jgi:cytochrome c-type biogenesis protein CcmF
MRIDSLVSEPSEDAVVSREGAFLLNNLLLVTLMFTVLVGTLYPIIAEAIRGVKVSVGEPYFNRMAVPIFLGLLMLMGIGPALPWGRSDRRAVIKALTTPLPAAIVAMIVFWVLGARTGYLLFTAALTGYALWVTFAQALLPALARRRRGEAAGKALTQSMVRSPRRIGGYLVHFGLIVTFAAVAISSTYQRDAEATLRPGQSMEVGGYSLQLDNVEAVREPHMLSRRATVTILRDGRDTGQLVPALNQYPTMREPIGTPAVRTSLGLDLYLTLQNVGSDGSVGLRAIITPAVSWIWIGVLVMVAGTVVCLIPPSKRRAAA